MAVRASRAPSGSVVARRAPPADVVSNRPATRSGSTSANVPDSTPSATRSADRSRRASSVATSGSRPGRRGSPAPAAPRARSGSHGPRRRTRRAVSDRGSRRADPPRSAPPGWPPSRGTRPGGTQGSRPRWPPRSGVDSSAATCSCGTGRRWTGSIAQVRVAALGQRVVGRLHDGTLSLRPVRRRGPSCPQTKEVSVVHRHRPRDLGGAYTDTCHRRRVRPLDRSIPGDTGFRRNAYTGVDA